MVGKCMLLLLNHFKHIILVCIVNVLEIQCGGQAGCVTPSDVGGPYGIGTGPAQGYGTGAGPFGGYGQGTGLSPGGGPTGAGGNFTFNKRAVQLVKLYVITSIVSPRIINKNVKIKNIL